MDNFIYRNKEQQNVHLQVIRNTCVFFQFLPSDILWEHFVPDSPGFDVSSEWYKHRSIEIYTQSESDSARFQYSSHYIVKVSPITINYHNSQSDRTVYLKLSDDSRASYYLGPGKPQTNITGIALYMAAVNPDVILQSFGIFASIQVMGSQGQCLETQLTGPKNESVIKNPSCFRSRIVLDQIPIDTNMFKFYWIFVIMYDKFYMMERVRYTSRYSFSIEPKCKTQMTKVTNAKITRPVASINDHINSHILYYYEDIIDTYSFFLNNNIDVIAFDSKLEFQIDINSKIKLFKECSINMTFKTFLFDTKYDYKILDGIFMDSFNKALGNTDNAHLIYMCTVTNCYMFNLRTPVLTWDEAEHICRSHGGHLLSINSGDEWTEVKQWLFSKHVLLQAVRTTSFIGFMTIYLGLRGVKEVWHTAISCIHHILSDL